MASIKLLIAAFAVLAMAFAATARMPVGGRAEEPTPLAKCWSYPASPDLSVSAGVDRNSIYFMDTERGLQAVDLISGVRLWSSDVGGAIVADLLVSGNAVFVVTRFGNPATDGQKNGRLRSISTQTGITNWVSDIPLTDRISLGVLNGTVVVASGSGELMALTRDSGVPAWSKNLGVGLASTPVFELGAVTVATVNNELFRIGEKGDLSRVTKLDHAPTALVSRSDRGTLIGDDRGNLVFISGGDKRDWSFKNGARISHILPFDSEYIVASDDNFIYKLTRGGDVEWKRRLSGRTAGKPLLTGNAVVVSVVGEGDVYVIDARNGKIVNRIELGDGVSAEVAPATDQKGFTVLHPQGLIRYGEDACGAK